MSEVCVVRAGSIRSDVLPRWDAAAVGPETILFAVLLLHVAALSAVALLTQPTLPLDLVEQSAWAHDPQWVYFKHPPLPAWTLWFLDQATGHSQWAPAIIGPVLTALTLWIVFKLALRFVDAKRALLAAIALEGVVYFNFTSLEFNHNIVQLPLWALMGYFGHRACREGRTGDWLALGASAALGMLGKYSSALMIVSVLAAVLADPQGRQRFKSFGPWLAMAAASVLLVPHIVALAGIHFAPFRFPLERAAPAASIWDHLRNPLSFLAAQFVDVAAALLLLAVAIVPQGGETAVRPRAVAPLDRRFVFLIAFAPICLSLGLELISGARFLDMWGTPMWDFVGLAVVVAASGRAVSAAGLRRFAVLGCVVFGAALLARTVADVVPPYWSFKGERTEFPARALAADIEQGWHRQLGKRPLAVVAGSAWFGGLLTVYAADHPALMIDGACWKSPWLPRLSQSGAVLVWSLDDVGSGAAKLLAEFPHAVMQPPLLLRYDTGAPVPPARIGWAIVPPATPAPSCTK